VFIICLADSYNVAKFARFRPYVRSYPSHLARLELDRGINMPKMVSLFVRFVDMNIHTPPPPPPSSLCTKAKVSRGLTESDLRQFSIAVALPARAERTLLNFLCSFLTCAFFVRLNARGHAMKVELHSTFLACSGD
jgi:hypothetical protein